MPSSSDSGPSWLTTAAATVEGGEAALALVNGTLRPAIAHHSARVFRFATYLSDQEQVGGPKDLLFHACLLHDIGASEIGSRPGRYGMQRFEVQGADLAADFLGGHGYSAEGQKQVWQAIALHTSPHIAERLTPLTRLVRLAVRADFGADLVPSDLRQSTEQDCPRLDIERELSRVVVEQALADPARAPHASWPSALLAAHQASADPDARLSAF